MAVLSRDACRRFLALVVGFSARLFGGSLFIFNIYAVAYKNKFYLMQNDVEFAASCLYAGLSLGFVGGLLFERVGPIWSCLTGLFTSTSGFLLLWYANRHADYYSRHPDLMAFYYFLAGHGSVYTYIAASLTKEINFPHPHRRRPTLQIFNAMLDGSPALFALIYVAFFANGNFVGKEYLQSLGGFMLFLATISFAVNVTNIIALRAIPQSEDQNSDILLRNLEGGSTVSVTDESHHLVGGRRTVGESLPPGGGEESSWRRFWSMFTSLEYILYVWGSSFATMTCITFINNINIVLSAVELGQYSTLITLLIFFLMVPTRGVLSLLLDSYGDKLPMLIILALTYILITVSNLVCVFFADTLSALITSSIIFSIAIATILTLNYPVLRKLFGEDFIGIAWSSCVVIAALSVMVMQKIFASIYQHYQPIGSPINCYGTVCTEWSFVVAAVFSGISVFMTVTLIQRWGTCCCKSHK